MRIYEKKKKSLRKKLFSPKNKPNIPDRILKVYYYSIFFQDNGKFYQYRLSLAGEVIVLEMVTEQNRYEDLRDYLNTNNGL